MALMDWAIRALQGCLQWQQVSDNKEVPKKHFILDCALELECMK